MILQHRPYAVVARWAAAVLACSTAGSALHAQDSPPTIPTPDSKHAASYFVDRVTAECAVILLVDGQERELALTGVAIPKDTAAREPPRRFLESLLEAEAVFVPDDPESQRDLHERRSAYLFRAPDGLFVNLEIVRQGYAKVRAKPACEHLDVLRYYERRAKQARKGVWAPRSRRKPDGQARPAVVPRAPQSGQTIVYVTKSGKKYHDEDCYHLRRSSRALALRDAVKKGYEPCSHCKPPALDKP